MLDKITPFLPAIETFGLVISLFFIAFQLRGSNREARARTYQEILNTWNTFNLFLLENPAIREIRERGTHEYTNLSDAEKKQFHLLCEFELNFHDNMQFQKGYFFDKDMIKSWENSFIEWINRPGPRSYWEAKQNEWPLRTQDLVKRSLRQGVNYQTDVESIKLKINQGE